MYVYSTGVASDLVSDPWAVSGSRGPPVGGRHHAGGRRRRETATTGACYLDRPRVSPTPAASSPDATPLDDVTIKTMIAMHAHDGLTRPAAIS